MRLGIAVVRFEWRGWPDSIGPTLNRIGRTADQIGLDSFWVMDHFFQTMGRAESPMLESYAALGYIAGLTERIKLGALVTGVVYRHPGVLIKTVTSLDVLSGGRMYLGIGAAWNKSEASGLGIPFPPLSERYQRLEETLLIARRMWDGSTDEFRGEHYHLARPLNSPNSVQRPHPPILIGGSGPKKTLRLVAKYADACNFFHASWSGPIAPHLAALRQHCADIGRPFDEIEKTVYCDMSLASRGDAAAFLDELHVLAELGIDHTILGLPHPHGERALELLADIVPEAAKIASVSH